MSIPVNKRLYHLNGLSTDTKPIPSDISTGSTFLETDTGTTYVFSRATGTWKPLEDETSGKVIDAVCIGIVSIDKIKTEGLVDTYAIKYTNGASTTFTVTNGTFIEPNTTQEEETLIPNKLYTLDIDTNNYNIHDLFNINSETLEDGSLESAVIDHTKYWPRLTDGKFVLNVSEKSFSTVFEFVNTNEQGQDIWQAFVLDEENSFVRYVGHFEYVDDHNRDSSDYYFVAKPQTIKEVDTLEADLADTKALLEETRAELVVESQRAITKEDELQEAVDSLEFDKDRLFTELNQEVSRAVIVEQTIKADLERDLDEEVQRATTRENELDALKAERTNPEQVILAGKFIVDNDEIDDDRLTINVEQGEENAETNVDVHTLETNVRIRRNLTTEIGNESLSNANVDTIIHGGKTTVVETIIEAENDNEEDTRLSVSETIANGNITEELTGTKSIDAGAIETSSETLEVNTLNNVSVNTSSLDVNTNELNINANGFGTIYTATRAEELAQESPEAETGEINSLNIEADDTLNVGAEVINVETGDCNINLNNETNINARNITEQIRAINTTVDRTVEYKAGLEPSESESNNYAVTFEANNQGAQLTVDGTYTEVIGTKETTIQGNETKTVESNLTETVEGNVTEQIDGDLNQHVEGQTFVNYETKAQIAFGKEVRQAEDVEEPYYSDAYILFNTNNEEQPEDRQTSLEIVSEQNLTLEANEVVVNAPNQRLGGSVEIVGDTTIESDLEVQQNTDLQGTLDVAEKATFDKAVEIIGATTSNGITNTGIINNTGNITNSGNLTNTGALAQHGAVTIDGGTNTPTTITSRAAITNIGAVTNTGNITNTGILDNTGNVVVHNTAQTGTTVTTTINESGVRIENGNLNVVGHAYVAGSAQATQFTQTDSTKSNVFEGRIVVGDRMAAGTTGLEVTNNAQVDGDTRLKGTLTVDNKILADDSKVNITKPTNITGATNITGTLHTTDVATFDTNIIIKGSKITKQATGQNDKDYTLPSETGTLALVSQVNAAETAAKNYADAEIDAEIRDLNASLGSRTKLISTITETAGKLSACDGPTILDTINASPDIPTSSAVKTYADNINTNLQNQIDNLKSVQNVVDVVEHYSELASKSAICDENDCIQVIRDENAHNERPSEYTVNDRPASIYRLIIVGGVKSWNYIGSYSEDSYTKTQINLFLADKADKIATVSTVTYDINNKKFTKTINAATTDIVSIATLKADMALNNVDNTSDVSKPISTATQSALDLKADKLTTYTKDDIDDKLENIPLALYYENSELYEVFNDGRTQTVVTVDTLSADLATANTLSISGTRGSITAAQYSKLNKETIVIWEAPDNSGNVALHYSSLVNVNEPSYQGFYGLPFTDGMVTVLVTFADDLTWEVIYDGAIAETTANRVSAFQNNPDNTHYPTEKLVKDYVDNSIETASEITDNDYNDIENAFQAALNPSVEE